MEQLDFANEFSLFLYHNGFLDKEWEISKTNLKEKFSYYCMSKGISPNFEKNIEVILKECNILKLITLDSFIFNFFKIYEYESLTLTKLDKEQIEKPKKSNKLRKQNQDLGNDQDQHNFKSEAKTLEFISCTKQRKNHRFNSKKDGCHICQRNFSRRYLRMHISMHYDLWLRRRYLMGLQPNFEVSYQICSNHNDLNITFKTEKRNIRIEKVMTIKSNSIITFSRMYHDDQDPVLKDGFYSYIVDDEVFEKTQQAVVIIYQMEDNMREIFIEYFLFSNEEISRRINLFKGFELKDYQPDLKLKTLYFGENPKNELMMYNSIVDEYFKNGKNLTVSNIIEILKFLINLEDIETENFYSKLTQNVIVERAGSNFAVKLSKDNIENILSFGDKIILKNYTNNRSKIFSGAINHMCGKMIYFEVEDPYNFWENCHANPNYIIEFQPFINRLNLRYQYSAIEILERNHKIKSLLFPNITTPITPVLLRLDMINENVETNSEQKQTVINIVNGIENLPYIIVGPPGTGKTTTIVESILQVKLCHPESRILVTAGSNAACDEIGKRLINLIKSKEKIGHIKMLRIYAKSIGRKSKNIDELLIESSNLVPICSHLKDTDYDVIICTLSIVGRLKASEMSNNFWEFSYCFIDECAASTEAEALIAITAVYHSKINIVLAGDPKQLGPILKSRIAEDFGLNCSLMERLLKFDCYSVQSDKSYNERIQTKLVKNFRTHSDILEISNSMFYSNDLISCAPREITHWAMNWYCLKEIGIPIIFDCVNGYTEKDIFSTSLYNAREVDVVMNYVKKLMYFNKINGREIKEEDIGIISPYKKQYLLIREELHKRHWYKIVTGSVETFQGQEKPITIISTVRSIYSDKIGPGFLNDPKRLNVMLTRAQALLIIVGNPELLETVEYWEMAINYFKRMNIFTGDCRKYLRKSERGISEPNLVLINKLQTLSLLKSNAEESKP